MFLWIGSVDTVACDNPTKKSKFGFQKLYNLNGILTDFYEINLTSFLIEDAPRLIIAYAKQTSHIENKFKPTCYSSILSFVV